MKKVYLCQPRSTDTFVPVLPYAQLALAAEIEGLADVRISGYAENGVHPTADQILREIEDFKPDVVGITSEYAIANDVTVRLARMIKEWQAETTVVTGGHHATFQGERLLRTGVIDAVFVGEGEASFSHFLREGDYRTTPGVMFLNGDRVVRTGPTPLKDMEKLKPPAFHLIRRGVIQQRGIESSRGCPYDCDFCETRNFFNRGALRKMSPERFIDNLKRVIDVTGGGSFAILDDCFTADMKGHVRPICEALVAEQLPADFWFQARVDNMLANLDMLPLMAEARMKSMFLGVESIYEQSLRAMNKKAIYSPHAVRDLILRCKDVGMGVIAAVMFGYPDETVEMIDGMADYMVDTPVDAIQVTMSTPIPGSALLQRTAEAGLLLSTDPEHFDGNHRIVTTTPRETTTATDDATRKYYLRPEYIESTLENALDLTKMGMNSFMAATYMCMYLTQAAKAQPRTTEEWLLLFEGLRRVLARRMEPGRPRYTATIRLKFFPFLIYLRVEDGLPVKFTQEALPYDVDVEADVSTLLDLFIWCPLDILSGVLFGKVKIIARPEGKLDFIRWMDAAQGTLRWQRVITNGLPAVRRFLTEQAAKSPRTYPDLTGLLRSDATIYIGTRDRGGLVLAIDGQKGIREIRVAAECPDDATRRALIEQDEFEDILNGKSEYLLKFLQRVAAHHDQGRTEAEGLLQPRDFFARIPASKFVSEKSAGIGLLVQFIITRASNQEERWWMKIADRKLSIGEGEALSQPTATVISDLDSYVRLMNGKASPLDLFYEGKMKLKGLPETMLQLQGCFDRLFEKGTAPAQRPA